MICSGKGDLCYEGEFGEGRGFMLRGVEYRRGDLGKGGF